MRWSTRFDRRCYGVDLLSLQLGNSTHVFAINFWMPDRVLIVEFPGFGIGIGPEGFRSWWT